MSSNLDTTLEGLLNGALKDDTGDDQYECLSKLIAFFRERHCLDFLATTKFGDITLPKLGKREDDVFLFPGRITTYWDSDVMVLYGWSINFKGYQRNVGSLDIITYPAECFGLTPDGEWFQCSMKLEGDCRWSGLYVENLEVKEFSFERFATLEDFLKETKIPPSVIVLELFEKAIIRLLKERRKIATPSQAIIFNLRELGLDIGT